MRRFWGFIAGSRRKRLVTGVTAATVLALLVTMFAGGFRGSPTPARADYLFSEGCTSADAEANVRVTVYSNAGRSECEALDRGFGQGGSFWRVQPAATLEGELVCSLESGKEHVLIEVRDTGGHYYGNKICAYLTGRDYVEREGPGGEAERRQREHEAEEQQHKEESESKEKAEQEKKNKQEERKRQAEEKKQEAKEVLARKHEEATQHSEEDGQHTKEAEEHRQEEGEHEAEQRKNEAEQRSEHGQQEREQNAQRSQEAQEHAKEQAEREAEQHKEEAEQRKEASERAAEQRKEEAENQ